MKRLLYLCIILISLRACADTKLKEKDWIWVNFDTDLTEFKGKTISQMFPGDGDQVIIIFTDTTRVTICTSGCNLKLFK